MAIVNIGTVDLSSVPETPSPGVAISDNAGNVYVSDQGTGSVYKISSTGALITTFSSLPSSEYGINGMAYSPITNLIYVLFNDSIYSLTTSGVAGSPIVLGSGGTTFGITVDPVTGNIYALYSASGPVFNLAVFNSSLVLQNTYNVASIGTGTIQWTPNGQIALTSQGSSEVKIMDTSAHLISTVNVSDFVTFGQLFYLAGMAYLPNYSNVLILDSNYNVLDNFGSGDSLGCVDGFGSGLLAVVGTLGFLPDTDNSRIMIYSGFPVPASSHTISYQAKSSNNPECFDWGFKNPDGQMITNAVTSDSPVGQLELQAISPMGTGSEYWFQVRSLLWDLSTFTLSVWLDGTLKASQTFKDVPIGEFVRIDGTF